MKRQVEDNKERLLYIQKRIKERGTENSIVFVDGRRLTGAEDVVDKDLSWFYRHGCNLGSTCYLLSCLFAYLYRTKHRMAPSALESSSGKQILVYIEKLLALFNIDFGVFYVTQYDIGQLMFSEEPDKLIPYLQFCQMIRN